MNLCLSRVHRRAFVGRRCSVVGEVKCEKLLLLRQHSVNWKSLANKTASLRRIITRVSCNWLLQSMVSKRPSDREKVLWLSLLGTACSLSSLLGLVS